MADRSEKKNTPLLIGILAVLVALTAYFTLRAGSGKTTQLDTPESADAYLCLEDGNVFKLTPAAFLELKEAGKVKTTGNELEGGMAVVECPKCRKMQGVRAHACPNDQTMFARRVMGGKPGKCPKCGWSLYGG